MKQNILSAGICAAMTALAVQADIVNQSMRPIYVQDEVWGKVHMLLPGESWHQSQDALAIPFQRRNAIYKTADGVSVVVEMNGRIDAGANNIRGGAGQVILGGWKDRAWVMGKDGYQFRRLFNLSAEPNQMIQPER